MKLDTVYQGNNIDVLKTFPDNSIDSIVTDPPYGISFMNKHWDYDVPNARFWKECLRVLKPGGHMLVACGTRTQHRMAVNIEDGGFEIRDIIAWIYGSGFPKSMNIALAIDKKLGFQGQRGVGGFNVGGKGEQKNRSAKLHIGSTTDGSKMKSYDNAKSEEAKQWEGWGTALKPAMELWTLARKPIKGTVAENVLKYGTGGINIDECRVDFVSEKDKGNPLRFQTNDGSGSHGVFNSSKDVTSVVGEKGRWPANVIHDGSEEVVKLFPSDGENSVSRFFYTAKASQTERNWGGKKNIHPTVKPIDLMRYLVRLITPKGGVCLDPFLGSGTTAVACKAEKFNYIGIELMPEYVEIAEARIKAETVQYDIFDFLGDER